MSTAKYVRRIDVFVSSPGDVKEERRIVLDVLNEINEQYSARNKYTLNALAYETMTPPVVGKRPQNIVDEYMSKAGDSDIFICIFWNRMGTPVISESSNRQFDSGTEYEFISAYESQQQNATIGMNKPIMLLYRSYRPIDPALVDTQQLAKVQQFFERFEGKDSEFRGLYSGFSSVDEFRKILRRDLEVIIAKHFEQINADVPSKSNDAVTWDELALSISRTTREMLDIRYKAKYLNEYYSERTYIKQHFRDFLASDKVVMVITGKAGTGKSTFLCDLANFPPANTIVWLQDCAHMQLGTSTIDEYLRRDLNLRTGFLETLGTVVAENFQKRVILIFDAVNENTQRHLLLEALSVFIKTIPSDQVKVVITCRTPIWDAIKMDFRVPLPKEFHTAGPNSYVNLNDFSDAEVAEVYARYKMHFRLQTEFSDLSKQVKQFIAQPLFLKLMAIVYENKRVPDELALRDVLGRYIRKCLSNSLDDDHGFDPYSTQEYLVLRRAIELMYEHARRDLDVSILKSDAHVGQFVTLHLDTPTPYTHLVAEGLLSQKLDEGKEANLTLDFIRQIELVFVTYERVFEYLLAQIAIGQVTPSKLLEVLDIAKRRSFAQLRGAAELALSFALISKQINIASVIEITYTDRPEIRQFLCDVIHTIYTSGYRELAEEILEDLITDESNPEKNYLSQVLSVQAAFQLRLDKYLIQAAISNNERLREIASLYLYQRWNKARLDGDLSDAYGPVETIATHIKPLRNPQKTIRAASALISLSVSMGSHAIDDPQSLVQLIEIARRVVNSVPGIDPRPGRGILNNPGAILAEGLMKVLSFVAKFVIHGTIAQGEIAEDFFSNGKNKRAFADATILFDQVSLLGHEDELIRLIQWDNLMVAYATTFPMIWHLYNQPELHVSNLMTVYGRFDRFHFRSKYLLTYAIGFACLVKAMRGEQVPEEMFTLLRDNFSELFNMADEANVRTDEFFPILDGMPDGHGESALTLVLVEILTIEAYIQRKDGNVVGSDFIPTLIADSMFNLRRYHLAFFLKSIERATYQGLAEFGAKTILAKKFRSLWERKANDDGIRTLVNVRALYQEEVDSILLSKQDENREILDEIRMSGNTPDIHFILYTNTILWIVAASVNITLCKVCGAIMTDMISVDSMDEFLKKVPKTIISALYDFDLINILNMYWRTTHDSEWDGYEKWGIPRNLNDKEPEVHKYWVRFWEDFVRQHGRGIVYGEL